jgi:hypothetical protein
MSPTILRREGYQVKIYLNDHPPAHVHVAHAGNEARIGLVPVEVKNNWGFNTREIGRILAIIHESKEFLLAEWDRYHPER